MTFVVVVLCILHCMYMYNWCIIINMYNVVKFNLMLLLGKSLYMYCIYNGIVNMYVCNKIIMLYVEYYNFMIGGPPLSFPIAMPIFGSNGQPFYTH